MDVRDREEIMADAALVGDVLAPLFLCDPVSKDGEAVMQELATIDAGEAARDWPFVDDERALACFEEMAKGIREEGLEAASHEYRRLFVGPFALPCPPWGSVYTDRDCVMFGESTLALRSWMRQCGIAPLQGNKEPDDHIGRLIALMAWVAREMPERLDEYLSCHVLTWAFHYFDLLGEAARHPLYRGLASLSSATFAGMRDELALEVVTPRFYR